MTPENHSTNFPDSWWNEQRKRDYYVDGDSCVRLRPDSPTAQKLEAALISGTKFYCGGITWTSFDMDEPLPAWMGLTPKWVRET